MAFSRWFLPKDGGGHVRRYLKFRKAMLRRVYESEDRYPVPPVTIFDFADRDDAVDAMKVGGNGNGGGGGNSRDGWRLSDDRVIGGFSTSTARLIRNETEYRKYLLSSASNADDADDGTTADPDGQKETKEEDEGGGTTGTFQPFIRWSGHIDTTIGLQSNAQRSGFAAIRSPEFPMEGANLRGMYGALEIVCRSPTALPPSSGGDGGGDGGESDDDQRIFTVNLKVSSSIPNDLYQGHIQHQRQRQQEPRIKSSDDVGDAADGFVLESEFERFVLPFDEFKLTSMGRERHINRTLDDNVCIESVGIALMDGRSGPFAFDLARIRAVNLYEGAVFEQKPEREEEKY